MAAELASGFIRLSVKYDSAMSKIARDFNVIENTAKSSGRKTGRGLSDGIDAETKGVGSKVASNVENGLDRTAGERIGRRFGDAIARAMNRSSKKSGKDFAKEFESSTSGLVKATKTVSLFAAAAGGAVVALGSLGPLTVAFAGALAAVAGAAGGAAIAGLSALGLGVASIKVAMLGLQDTFKLAFDPTKVAEFNAAMAKLGPQTQTMVKGVVGLVQAWKDSGAQIAVQDALFANLGGRLNALKQFIAPVRDAMVSVNTAINQAATGFLDFVNSGRGAGLITTLLDNAANIARNFATAIGNLGPGFLALATAAGQFFAPLTTGFGEATKKFSDMLLEMQKTGELQSTFQKLWDIVKQVGGALQQVGGIIAAVLSAAAAAGGGNALGGLTDKLKTLNQFFSQGQGREALITFFKSAQAAMGAILPVILEVAKVIGGTLAPIIANIATNVAPALIPAVKAIGDGIKAAAPQFESLANALKGVIEFITPALPILIQFAPAVLLIVGAMKAWAIITTAFTALQWLLNAALDANPIGLVVIAIAALVAGLVLLFNKNKGFHDFVVAAWEGIKVAFTATWAVIKPVLAAIGQALLWLWNNVVIPAFNGIKIAISVWWAYAQGVFAVIKTAVTALGDVFSWLWQNAIQPAWEGIKAVIAGAWAIIQPTWEAFKTGLQAIGDVATWLWNNAITPAFEGIKAAVSGAWAFLSGVFENIKTGFQVVSDFVKNVFNGVGDIIKGVFNGIVEIIKAPLREVGKVLQGIGNIHIPGTDIDVPAGDFGNRLAALRQGTTQVTGKGGTDNVLAWLTAGEGVVTKQAMANGGAPLVAALNSGWVPPAAMLAAMVGAVPGFAAGGPVENLYKVANALVGKPYAWGGHGPNGADCSGAASILVNALLGQNPYGDRMDTGSAEGWLTGKGAIMGKGPDGTLRIGWVNGGPGGGHMAVTLPDGRNAESGGSHGDFEIGGNAAGADDSQFTNQAYIPFNAVFPNGAPSGGGSALNYGTGSSGGGGGVAPGSGVGGGAATPKQLQTAQDKITDLQNKLDTSQLALDEAEKNPKTAESAKKTKRDAVEKNKRELDQAKKDLEDLKAKTDDVTGGKGGGSGSDNPFSKIGEGIGQLTDLAKSGIKETFLPPGFSDPEQWGVFKAVSSLLNFGSGLVGGLPEDKFPGAKTAAAVLGAGGQIAGGNTGSGVASLIGLIPKSFGDFNIGSPDQAPLPGEALQHGGTGALPGPGPGSDFSTATPGGQGQMGASQVHVDNSVHVGENGQVGTDPNKVLEASFRHQVAAQTPQLGTRRFV